MAKVVNNYNNLVKGSLTRQKLQNSKVYAKSPEFSPALGIIIFGKKSVAINLRTIRSLVRSITIFFWYTFIYIYIIYIYTDRPDYITLLACARG